MKTCLQCHAVLIRRPSGYETDAQWGRRKFCSQKCNGAHSRTLVRQRFESHFTRSGEDECWIWQSARAHGYGCFWFRNKTVVASRVAWIYAYGEIPAGMDVLHKCDQPLCVNPKHLFLGTDLDNVRDCIAKGRFKRLKTPGGSGHHNALFNDAQVATIRARAAAGHSQRAIARDFDCHRSTIGLIARGVTYANQQGAQE